MNDSRWVDITVIGSAYEEQLEVFSGQHRQRPLKMWRVDPFEEKGMGEWEYISFISTSNKTCP